MKMQANVSVNGAEVVVQALLAEVEVQQERITTGVGKHQ